jgi:transglutaminase-like putative cysteine protease
MSDGITPPAGALPEEIAKWEFLRDAPLHDSQTPEIQRLANHFARAASCSPWPAYVFACLAQCLAKDCITYVLDTDRVGREQIDGYTDPQGPADMSYLRGSDDCDGKARLFVALCLADKLQARMVGRWQHGKLAHVYAEVYVTGPHEDHPRWWSVETILRRARLGDVAETVPKELETGKWSQ